jgi:hypothetical protein
MSACSGMRALVVSVAVLGCQSTPTADPQPCARTLAAYCDGGACPPSDWASAVAAAKHCSGGSTRFYVSEAPCSGVRVTYQCGVDACTYNEYDAVTNKLVAIVGDYNLDVRCVASDLAPGATPMPPGGMTYSPHGGPICSWPGELVCCDRSFPNSCPLDAGQVADAAAGR